MSTRYTVEEYQDAITVCLRAGDMPGVVAALRLMAAEHPYEAADLLRVMQKATRGELEVTMRP